MWDRLRTLINLDTFCMGCSVYYDMLAAMGLVSDSYGSLVNDGVAPEPFTSSAGIDVPNSVGTALPLVVSVLPVNHWAAGGEVCEEMQCS